MSDHRIVLGDCLDPVSGLASLPDKSVDVVITDPPYASEIYQRCKKNPARSNGGGRGRRSTNKYSVGLKALTDGAIGTLDDVLEGSMAHVARITRRWALVFCDVESLYLVRGELVRGGMRYVRTGVWAKEDPMPQFSGDRPAQGFEACAIAYGGDEEMWWNGGGKAGLWRHGVCKTDRPDHPCPKPLELMEELVRDFTDPGELICDPFAGSGTTGVACKRLGRRFLGWEMKPEYAAVAQKRIENAREQMVIGGPRPPRPKQSSMSLDALEERAASKVEG